MPPRATTSLPLQHRLRSHSPEETARLAARLGARLRPVPPEGWVLALEGDLGAGKTVFVRGLARGLGLPPEVPVASPTFTVAQRFDLPDGLELHHLDAFRLQGVDELEAAGWEDECGKGRVTCVEWAERVAGALPTDRLEVRMTPSSPLRGLAPPSVPPKGKPRGGSPGIVRGPRAHVHGLGSPFRAAAPGVAGGRGARLIRRTPLLAGWALLAALAGTLRADPPAAGASVTVLDDEGRVVAGARLSPAGPGPDGAPVLDPVSAPGSQADAEGRLALPTQPAPVEGGTWVVWAPGRAARRLPAEPGATLVLAPGATVRGKVRWSGGRAAGALDLLVEPLGVAEPVAVLVKTDAEGRYRTDLVGGTEWRISFRRGDGRFTPLRLAGTTAGDHVAPQPGVLKGRLIDGRASGTVGVPGLAVRLVRLPRGTFPDAAPLDAKSDETGAFLLPDVAAAVYELDLLDPDWMYDQPSARVDVLGEGHVREEHWYVMRRASVVGQVLGRESKPVAGARVRLLPDPRLEGTPAVPFTAPEAVTTDAEGRYRFVRVVPAEGYRLLASATAYAPFVSTPFEVDPNGETKLNAVTLPSGWSLDLEVRDAASKPLAGVRVLLTSAGHPSAGLDPAFDAFKAEARTDGSGVAAFTGLPDDDMWVALAVPGHLPVLDPVRKPGTSSHLHQRLTLVSAPTLRGSVSDALGRPAPNHLVRARPRGLGGFEPREARTAADGKFVLPDLPLEALDLDVLTAQGRTLLHLEGVDPEQGTLDLALPPLQAIAGTVDGLAVDGPAAEVLLEAPVVVPDEDEPRWRTVERLVLARGATSSPFRFADLAPGPYAVRALQGARDTEAQPVTLGEEPPDAVSLLLPEGGSVAGVVVDGRGLPVLGVEVSLVRLRGDGATADLRRGVLRAATADRGGYSFSGVAPGLWRVEAGERGGGFDLELVRVADGESLVVRDLSTVAGGVIAGKIEDDRGQPVDGARLTVRALEHDLAPRTAVSGGDGGYRVPALPQGSYEVVLVNGPLVRLRREALVVVSEGETAELDFLAEGTASVEGTVLRGGKRAPGVPLLLEWLPEEGTALERTQRVVTDSTASFQVGGLRAGRYRLVLEDGVARTGGDVVLDDGERLTVDLELWEGRLTGEVLTKDGRTVANALVTALPSVPVVGVLNASARTDATGRFALAGLPIARYDLTARAEGTLEGVLRRAQADPPGSEHPVTIRLETGATLELDVRTRDGRPAAGARIAVDVADAAAPSRLVALTGPSGRIVVEGVPAGRVRVVAVARDSGRATAWLDTVNGETTRTELVLLPSGSLTLEVRGPDAAALRRTRVEVRLAGTKEPVLTRDPRNLLDAWLAGLRWRHGLLEARDLPAGDYEVLVAGPGWEPGRALVRVRAGDVTAARLDLVRTSR